MSRALFISALTFATLVPVAASAQVSAVDGLRAAARSAPRDYDAQLALGHALIEAGRFNEARSVLRRASRIRRGAEEAQLEVARVAFAERNYSRARSTCMAMQRANRESVIAHVCLARAFSNANRIDDARAALQRAHALDGDDPDVDFELGRLLSGAEAVPHLQEAAANRPGWALAESALGDALLEAGQHEEAAAAYRAAMGHDGELTGPRAGLGRALLAAGQHEAAEAALTEAIEQVPNDAGSVMALAQVFAQTSRVEQAYEQYRHAADLNPRNPRPLVEAARLALAQERPVLAVGYLQRVLGQHANHAPALALMGDVMRARRQSADARRYYERALSGAGEFDRAAVQRALSQLR